MSESAQNPEPGDNPTSEELDIEGPNESVPSHQTPPGEEPEADEQEESGSPA